MRHLRKIRIILSCLITLLATALIVSQNAALCCALRWVHDIQFMQALLMLNIGICAGWLIFTAVFGRIYCSSMCPLGTFQDAAAWVCKRISFRGKGHYSHSRAENRLRYVILGAVFICMIGGQFFLPHAVSPFEIYQNFFENLGYPALAFFGAKYVIPPLFGIFLSWTAFLLIGGLAFKHGRTYCNTICPVGSILSIASRRAVFQLEIDPDLCTSCGLCRDECKASCIDHRQHTIDNSRCVMCFNCMDVCPANAIRYTASRKGLSTPLMQALEDGTKVPQMSLDAPTSANLTKGMKRDDSTTHAG